MHSRWNLVLATGLLSIACDPDELPHFGTLQYQSENLEVWASDGLQACGGTYPYTEAWLAQFRGRTGEGSSGPLAFYWASAEEFEAYGVCEATSAACAYRDHGVTYSKLIPFEHELVHLELSGAQPPSLFAEGAAEMFGSIGSSFQPDEVDVASLLDATPQSVADYRTAGRFSRFIVDQYGVDAYLEAYEQLDGARGFAETDAGVKAALGIGLGPLLADFEAFPRCPIDRWRFYDLECSDASVVAWQSDTRWLVDVSLACGNDDVIGPRQDRTWTLRALEIPDAGDYRVRVASEDDTAAATILSCQRGCYADPPPASFATSNRVYVGALAGPVTQRLDPGRYWLRIEHAAGHDARVAISVDRID